MFLKIKTHLKTFLSVPVSEENRREFVESINKLNVSRAKTTALLFVFLETMLLLASVIMKKSNAFRVPSLYYTVMYLAMLFAMLVFYLIFYRFKKNIAGYGNEIQIAGIFFTSFILCWCAGISLLDQMSSGQIMVYIFAVISVAVTPLFEPVVLLLIYLPVHTAFIVLLPIASLPSGIPFGNIANSTTFIMISWIISLMRYKQQSIEFNNAKLIEGKNSELNRINIELQETNHMLEKLAQIDGLTGIYNRSIFDLTMKLEWDRCKRQFKPLSLLMIDIDFFKAFNDHYGHQAGDNCIRQVAGVLSSCAKRASDTVARYGGEEFAVILPCTGRNHAEMIAEQIREQVEKLAIPHEFSCTSKYVTISLGVYTAIPTNIIPIEEFIKNADLALYDAKKYRNNVVVSSVAPK